MVLPAPTRSLLFACLLLLSAALLLALTQARLGSRLFFVFAAAMAIAQLVALLAVRRAEPPKRWLWIAIGIAVACRIPLMVGPVNYDSDMVRYVWDGRVQRFGYNPYAVVPSDPAVAHTHTADTVRMPSRNAQTPYPPAAQLFFRLMVHALGIAAGHEVGPHAARHRHDFHRAAAGCARSAAANGWCSATPGIRW